MSYLINSDRNKPRNELPILPIDSKYYLDVEILTQLGESKAVLGRLQGRSIPIPNQGLLINSISLQEAKASCAIENIFTTDDELYKAFSEENVNQTDGAAKEIRPVFYCLRDYINISKNDVKPATALVLILYHIQTKLLLNVH